MKTKLYILIAVFFMSLGVNAQIDRSQQPKPGPAPKISLEKPQEFELKNGLKILVVENHKLPRVSFNIAFDREPVLEGEKAGVTALLGAMLANGTTTISKDDFNEEIDFLGARLNIGFGGGSANSLARYYMLYGDVNLINNEIDIYRSITREEIKMVANKYLNANQRLILEYLPESEKEQ